MPKFTQCQHIWKFVCIIWVEQECAHLNVEYCLTEGTSCIDIWSTPLPRYWIYVQFPNYEMEKKCLY